MKSWMKKVLALMLCLLMLTAMIPLGAISTEALNYAKSSFVIANVADWNAIASYAAANPDATFAGKTILLSKNVDFGGATIPTLFANNFAGTFDGQGNTLSSFTVSNALIAKTASGATIQNLNVTAGTVTSSDAAGMLVANNSGENLTIRNCSASGTVNCSGRYAGGLVGMLRLNDEKTATIENVTANVSVSNTKAGLSGAHQSAGGLVGTFFPYGAPRLVIKNANVSGSVSGGKGSAGGVLGAIAIVSDTTLSYYNVINGQDGVWDMDKPINVDETPYAGGSVTISNCRSNTAVTGTLGDATKDPVGSGGIIGSAGQHKYNTGDSLYYYGTLTVDNCVVEGSVARTFASAGTSAYNCGGVIGLVAFNDATINVEHCLIKASFPMNALNRTDGTAAGVILGQVNALGKNTLNVNNTVTTATGAWSMLGMVGAKPAGGGYYPWLTLNGKNLAQTAVTTNVRTDIIGASNAWAGVYSVSDGSVISVSAEAAASMVQTNAQGYIQRVAGQIAAIAIQDNVPDGAVLSAKDTYAIRFIGVTQVETAKNAQMNVVVRNTVSGVAFKSFTMDCQLYDGLTAYNDNGTVLQSYCAKDFGAKKFVALIVGYIPGGTAYTFEITPEYTMSNGMTMRGETISVTYDQNGQHVASLNSFDVDAYAKPTTTVRVMSSNIIADADANGNVIQWTNGDGVGGYDYLNSKDVLTQEVSTTNRLKAMAAMYLQYLPDFIGMQEVQEETNGGNGGRGKQIYNMQTEIRGYISSEYTMVDFSDKVAKSAHWNPMFYRTSKWTLVASDVDVNAIGAMWRWQWALYQSKSNPEEYFIHVNLHGPSGSSEQGWANKKSFYQEVNTVIKQLMASYQNVPIAITGDYNINLQDHAEYFGYLTDGTTLKSGMMITQDTECGKATCDYRYAVGGGYYGVSGAIDHVMVTSDLVTVQKHRILQNRALNMASDHSSVYVDLTYEYKRSEQYGSSMDWEDGMNFYKIRGNTELIKVLGERYLESGETLYADWTASGLEFEAELNSRSEIIFTANSTAPVYFKAYVDGALWQNQGSDYYTVSGAGKIVLERVPAGTHTIRLVKATGYTLGQAEISAVELDGTIQATPDNDLYIEFLGDSISCGWGVVGSHDGGYASQDGTLAYPYLVAQALGADYSIMGLSGRGVVYGTDLNFDKDYLSASPLRSDEAYAFERKADIVVINLGTNDRGLHADTAEFEAGYLRLLERVFENNGGDCIVYCLWGAMNDTYNTQIQNAIAAYRASHADAQIYTLELAASTVAGGDPSWGHPSASDHAGYTAALTNALKTVIS